jgi:hypothetical protein
MCKCPDVADSVTLGTVTAMGARMACTSGLSIVQRDQAKEEKEVRSQRLLKYRRRQATVSEIGGTFTCARAVTPETPLLSHLQFHTEPYCKLLGYSIAVQQIQLQMTLSGQRVFGFDLPYLHVLAKSLGTAPARTTSQS